VDQLPNFIFAPVHVATESRSRPYFLRWVRPTGVEGRLEVGAADFPAAGEVPAVGRRVAVEFRVEAPRLAGAAFRVRVWVWDRARFG
jgi:hypothetical protein